MTFTKSRSITICAAIFALIAIYYFSRTESDPNKRPESANSAQAAGRGVFNEGDRRQAIIRQLTELYVSRSGDASSRMIAGLEAAPAAFLNEELKRQGAKWRVNKGSEGEIEIYDVS